MCNAFQNYTFSKFSSRNLFKYSCESKYDIFPLSKVTLYLIFQAVTFQNSFSKSSRVSVEMKKIHLENLRSTKSNKTRVHTLSVYVDLLFVHTPPFPFCSDLSTETYPPTILYVFSVRSVLSKPDPCLYVIMSSLVRM